MEGSSSIADQLARLKVLESDFQRVIEAEKLESLAEFAAGAGHEINNPLTVISGRGATPAPRRDRSRAAARAGPDQRPGDAGPRDDRRHDALRPASPAASCSRSTWSKLIDEMIVRS